MHSQGSTAFSGSLQTHRTRGVQGTPKFSKIRDWKLPFKLGRLAYSDDPGSASLFARDFFTTNLSAVHCDGDGKVIAEYDLGAGKVTNAGANLLSWDFTWAGGATLKQANYHAIGTGATSDAVTDVWLQTAQGATSLAGTTNGYMTGTQSTIANQTSGNFSPIYQTVSTFSCNGGAGLPITEWILGVSNGALVTGQATGTAAGTLTNSGATFTTSGNGLQAWTAESFVGSTAAPVNTPTTTPMLNVKSNTGTVLTALTSAWTAPTWLSIANGAVATPGATSYYVIFPTAFDRRTFGTITLNNGDSLQVTYQLAITSGG